MYTQVSNDSVLTVLLEYFDIAIILVEYRTSLLGPTTKICHIHNVLLYNIILLFCSLLDNCSSFMYLLRR